MGTVEQLGVIGLSIIGFCIALYIALKRRKNSGTLCPRNGNCVKVINSTHSTLFGIHIEYFGMLYYASMVIFHIVALTFPMYLLYAPLFTPYFFFFLSIGACVISLYLLAIQTFKIHDFCVWCVSSAIASILILIIQLI